MIRISVSFSGKRGVGTRIDRFQTDDLEEVTEDKDFAHKKKKKKPKPKRNESIPYRQETNENRLTVRRKIWLGRLERNGAPPKRRRTLPNVR